MTHDAHSKDRTSFTDTRDVKNDGNDGGSVFFFGNKSLTSLKSDSDDGSDGSVLFHFEERLKDSI